MKFSEILVEIYNVVFTIVAAYAVAFAPYIIVMVFGISGWWAMLMFITVPVGGAIIVCMFDGF
jgi:hypothetical protein